MLCIPCKELLYYKKEKFSLFAADQKNLNTSGNVGTFKVRRCGATCSDMLQFSEQLTLLCVEFLNHYLAVCICRSCSSHGS